MMVIMGLSSPNRQQLLDPIRGIYVPATPEEKVRQRWICHMISSLGYPKGLFTVEKRLSELPHLAHVKVPDRRIDFLVYANVLQGGVTPLLLVECKVASLRQEQMDQLIGYNYYVGARFLAVVNEQQIQFGYRSPAASEYVFHSFLPCYEELLK